MDAHLTHGRAGYRCRHGRSSAHSSFLIQVDHDLRIRRQNHLVSVDQNRLTTAFGSGQHECGGGVVRGYRHGVAVPFEPEVHGVPVGRQPRLEGHLAVPDTESAEPADDHLPGSAGGGDVDALVGVALVVEEIDERRPAEVLDGAAGVADLDAHDGVGRGLSDDLCSVSGS